MSEAVRQHPSLEQLKAFALGRLTAAAQAQLESHIAQCEQCCRALRAVPDDTLLQQLRTSETPHDERVQAAVPAEDLPEALANHPRYRVVRQLGIGGMGAVYLAEHRLMERRVALKIIHRELLCDPQAVARFHIEVKAAARLAHPNIVTAYDAEQAGDLHFLVMEYIDGVTLARLVEEHGRLPVHLACQYARQTAVGLQHAHEQGMVHRDIKPQNLMRTLQGQIKILDFGLARLAPATTGRRRRITAVGAILGTPDYIAPEQASDAREADIRADLYSLGCTLYFLLTGQAPFPLGSSTQKLSSHLTGVPQPLGRLRPGVPRPLITVVQRLMAKDPDERYATPRELVEALAPFTQPAPEPVESKPARRPERSAQPVRRIEKAWVPWRRWTFAAAGVSVLIIVMMIIALWPRTPPGARSSGGDAARKAAAAAVVAREKSRVLFVVSHKDFWYPDYGPVRRVLEAGGVEVVVASSAAGEATPKERFRDPPITPDLLLQDARADDYDAVYFPGGQALEYLGEQPPAALARKLIAEMQKQNKCVAALCSGVRVLADAGVLRGRPAARPIFKAMVAPAAAQWVDDEPFVADQRLLTGRDWTDAEPFARKFLELLAAAR